MHMDVKLVGRGHHGILGISGYSFHQTAVFQNKCLMKKTKQKNCEVFLQYYLSLPFLQYDSH